MNFLKEIKCIMCLVKCSKYLYFAKKALCFVTILISAAMLLGLACGDGKDMAKKLRGMM
ncbi:MAG: hypothetical protein IJ491_04080 [Clostridia bacterium]|nr:hypothetical protein [Clostridia bacterium]